MIISCIIIGLIFLFRDVVLQAFYHLFNLVELECFGQVTVEVFANLAGERICEIEIIYFIRISQLI